MNLLDELERWIRFRKEGTINEAEFRQHLLRMCRTSRADVERILVRVADATRSLEMAEEIRCRLWKEEVSRDIEFIRQNSPLRPGTKISLSRSGAPLVWAGDRDRLGATVVRFVQKSPDSIPVVCVELDEPITSIDAGGHLHESRFAVLVANHIFVTPAWGAEGLATIYVAHRLPDDLAELALTDPLDNVDYRVA